MNQLVRTAPAAVLLLIATAAGADPRGLAMGGTDVAIARGADAVRWNPALLGMPDAPAFSIRLVQAGGEAGNNSFNLDQYRRLNGTVWGDAEKSEILGSVPSAGLRIDSNASGGSGMATRHFGFYADGIAAGEVTLARDGVDFALYGNDLNRTYNLSGSGARGYAAGRGLFGLALPLGGGNRSLGLQVGYERGIRWEEAATEQGTFLATQDTAVVLGSFLRREGTQGSGLTVGLGYAAMLAGGGVFSFAIHDLWNHTSWKGTDRRYHLQGGHGVSGSGNLDSLFTSSSDPAVAVEFTTHRAPLVSMGVSRRGGAMLVSGIVEKGLGESPGVSSQIRTAWGVEWSGLRLFALRGGLSLGGGEGTRPSGGIGVHAGPLRLDLGVASRGISASHSRGVAVSAGALVEI